MLLQNMWHMFGVAIIHLSNITGCLIIVFAEDHVIKK